MDADKMEDLLKEIGLGDKMRIISSARDTNIMFLCPFHGERNPSCGISADKEIGACFTCGKSFTLAYLVAYMKECSIVKAKDFLEERFNVSKKSIKSLSTVRHYEDVAEEKCSRHIIPNYKLAPYRSGKVCHEYLLNRGFSKQTCREFKFGWDSAKNRITIPIFWEDGSLSGFIGRAVLEPKINGEDNPVYKKVYGNSDKYLVYEFEKSRILFPLNLFVPNNEEAIIVEGSLDSAWMHQLGFKNTLAILGSKISREQLSLLSKMGIKKLVLFLDNDEAGFDGKNKLFLLAKHDFICYDVVYPEGKNDPQNLSYNQVYSMLNSKIPFGKTQLKRID